MEHNTWCSCTVGQADAKVQKGARRFPRHTSIAIRCTSNHLPAYTMTVSENIRLFADADIGEMLVTWSSFQSTLIESNDLEHLSYALLVANVFVQSKHCSHSAPMLCVQCSDETHLRGSLRSGRIIIATVLRSPNLN